MASTIWFDMDGTIADLYAVDGWLDYLQKEDTYPYDNAAVMVHMSTFARFLHKAQKNGYKIGIISWTSKNGTDIYNGAVALSKMVWLHKHLPSVAWDSIKIVPYGTNKRETCGDGILFDDEEKNRKQWGKNAYEPIMIMKVLKNLK